MNAADIQNRILTLHERQMASLVDGIGHIEATSYNGVGVEKIYLHEGADVTRAISQLASSALSGAQIFAAGYNTAFGITLWSNGCSYHPAKSFEQVFAGYQA